MAIQWIAGDTFTCVSTDTKPTLVPAETKALETNTDNTYRFNGTSWVLFSGAGGLTATSTTTMTNKTMHNDSNTFAYVGAYNSIIYKSGSTYKAKKGDGSILASSTVLDGVVQAALDNKGLIKWHKTEDGSTYVTSSSVAWDIYSDTWLDMRGADIVVPQGYSGMLFRISDRSGGADHVARRIVMEGGFVQQGGATPSATWTGLEIESTSSSAGAAGVTMCQFRGMYFKRCGVGIRLKSDAGTASFITGITFDSITLDFPHEGFVFQTTGVEGSAQQVASRNIFINCIAQADFFTTTEQYKMYNGFKDISGRNNAFIHCKSWDTNPAHGVSSNITDKASDTVIDGGMLTYVPYDWELTCDLGKRTWTYADPPFGTPYGAYGSNVSLLNPLIRKVGIWTGSSSSSADSVLGDGLISSLGKTGSISTSITTNGVGKRFPTSATINTLAGLRVGIPYTARYWNPFTVVRFNLNQITNQRVFIGYATSTSVTIATTDDPLVSLIGYGLYHSTTNGTSATNWLVARNTGAASSTFENTGVAANNTAVKNVYVAAAEQGPKFQWRVDQSYQTANNNHTTTIPAQLSQLIFGIWISNTQAEDKTMDVWSMYTKNGRSETA